MKEKGFETLLKINKEKYPTYPDRWSPTCPETFREALKFTEDSPERKRVLRNISYRLVSLEFIEKQLNELILHNIIKKNLWKDAIVSGAGIIESLLRLRLKDSGVSGVSRMNYETLINSAKENNALSIANETFDSIHTFRDLRNKIHLFKGGDDNCDYDFFNFDEDAYKEMLVTLHSVLTAPEICSDEAPFEFLLK